MNPKLPWGELDEDGEELRDSDVSVIFNRRCGRRLSDASSRVRMTRNLSLEVLS